MSQSVDVTLAETLDSATLKVGGGSVTLDAEAMTQLLRDLGNARLAMQPPVADKPAEGEANAVVNPTWYLLANAVEGGHALVLRHPAYGWLHFMFQSEKAVDLVNAFGKAVLSTREGEAPAQGQA